MSVPSNPENMEFVEPKLLGSVCSEIDNVKGIPEEDALLKSNSVAKEMSGDTCHIVKNNINDNFELEGATNNLNVKVTQNDVGLDVHTVVKQAASEAKDKHLNIVTSKSQRNSELQHKADESNHIQNGLENLKVTTELCETDLANNVTATTSTDSAGSISEAIQSEDKQKTVNSPVKNVNDAGKVVLQSKSSASLSNLLVYNSNDESSDDSSCEEDTNKEPFSAKNVFRIDSSSSSSVSSGEFMYDSDGDYSSSEEISAALEEAAGGHTRSEPKETPLSLGELTVNDLPPVPDISNLSINVDEKECVHMGNVSGIVDQFVIVDSLPNLPPYNLDTILFLGQGTKPLGRVFDVMGPVTAPIYVVRFNTADDIKSLNVSKGMKIYSAPNTEHTQYVFLRQLMQMKGSDASWVGDNEVPTEFQDFSDDEEERKRKSGIKQGTRKRNSLERHQSFEKEMNSRNTMDTVRRSMKDPAEPAVKKPGPQNFARPRPYHFAARSGPSSQSLPPVQPVLMPPTAYPAFPPSFVPTAFPSFSEMPFFNPNVPPPPVELANNSPLFPFGFPPQPAGFAPFPMPPMVVPGLPVDVPRFGVSPPAAAQRNCWGTPVIPSNAPAPNSWMMNLPEVQREAQRRPDASVTHFNKLP